MADDKELNGYLTNVNDNDNYFIKLSEIPIKDKTADKNGLSYLSWGWAWYELKKAFPDATYKVYENSDGWNYFTDGRTAWVKTGVTVNGIEYIETLPIMNYNNKSIPLANITSFEVNKTIQRSLTKCIARHGLGITLYFKSFEDIPEEDDGKTSVKDPKKASKAGRPSKAPEAPSVAPEAVPEGIDYRKELKAFIATVGLNEADIIQVCGLNANSSAKDYKVALDYARGLVS